MIKSKCSVGSNLRVLLEAINEVPYGTAFIEDDNKKLVGIFTDGDFRRLLLKGKGLEDLLHQLKKAKILIPYSTKRTSKLTLFLS